MFNSVFAPPQKCETTVLSEISRGANTKDRALYYSLICCLVVLELIGFGGIFAYYWRTCDLNYG